MRVVRLTVMCTVWQAMCCIGELFKFRVGLQPAVWHTCCNGAGEGARMGGPGGRSDAGLMVVRLWASALKGNSRVAWVCRQAYLVLAGVCVLVGATTT